MYKVEILAATLTSQARKVHVVVNVVAHLLPQAVKGSVVGGNGIERENQ